MRKKWKKKTLYIASFLEDDLDDYGNNIATYAKPVFIGLENIQPLSGSTDVAEYGTKVNKIQKVLLDWLLRIKNDLTVSSIDNTPVEKFNTMEIKKLQIEHENIENFIKENDLAYLDGATPDGEKSYGDNANYRVDSVRRQNKKIAIYFEKLPNK